MGPGQGGAGLGWGRAEGELGVSALTGSCADTSGNGTQPGPTSCQLALARSASGISGTGIPGGGGGGVQRGDQGLSEVSEVGVRASSVLQWLASA